MNGQVQGDDALSKGLEATNMPRLRRFEFAAGPGMHNQGVLVAAALARPVCW